MLHEAVKLGNTAMIAYLIDKCGSKLANFEDFRGISALALACKVKMTGNSTTSEHEARRALIRMMVEKGAKIDAGVVFAAYTKDQR